MAPESRRPRASPERSVAGRATDRSCSARCRRRRRALARVPQNRNASRPGAVAQRRREPEHDLVRLVAERRGLEDDRAAVRARARARRAQDPAGGRPWLPARGERAAGDRRLGPVAPCAGMLIAHWQLGRIGAWYRPAPPHGRTAPQTRVARCERRSGRNRGRRLSASRRPRLACPPPGTAGERAGCPTCSGARGRSSTIATPRAPSGSTATARTALVVPGLPHQPARRLRRAAGPRALAFPWSDGSSRTARSCGQAFATTTSDACTTAGCWVDRDWRSSCGCSGSRGRASSSARTAAMPASRRQHARAGRGTPIAISRWDRRTATRATCGAASRCSAAGPTSCSDAPISSRTCRGSTACSRFRSTRPTGSRCPRSTMASSRSCTRPNHRHYKGTRFLEDAIGDSATRGSAGRARRGRGAHERRGPGGLRRRRHRRRPVPARRLRDSSRSRRWRSASRCCCHLNDRFRPYHPEWEELPDRQRGSRHADGRAAPARPGPGPAAGARRTRARLRPALPLARSRRRGAGRLSSPSLGALTRPRRPGVLSSSHVPRPARAGRGLPRRRAPPARARSRPA